MLLDNYLLSIKEFLVNIQKDRINGRSPFRSTRDDTAAAQQGVLTMQTKKLCWVGIFAISFAFVEASVVVYLRQMYGIHNLLRDIPAFDSMIAFVEVGREFSTLVMLFAAGWATGRSFQSRLGFAFFAFGLWDIFYYIWLKLFINWPESLLTPDILFLIPLPWWGPVIGPVLLAALMIIGGSLAVIAADYEHSIQFSALEIITLLGGILVMLYSFMENSLSALPANLDTLSQLRPSTFSYHIYIPGLIVTVYILIRAYWSLGKIKPGVVGINFI